MERNMRDLDDLLDRLVVRQKRADQRLSHLERLETQGDASRAWAQSVGMLQMFPGLRGLWPMSAFDSNGDAQDISGHGLHLTMNSSGKYAADGLAPFCALDGGADYFSRADEANLDITGTEGDVAADFRGLTLGGWFWRDVSAGNNLLSKYNSSGVDQRAYLLQVLSNDTSRFLVSSDGTSGGQLILSGPAVSTGTWHFIAVRFTPSSELKIWVDADTEIETSSVPASIFDSSADFRIGADGAGGGLLDGRASLCFLAAAAVPDIFLETFYQYSKNLFS